MTPSSVNQAIQINKTGLRNASATNSMGGKELGKQDFLNLLMTQMANQDPLDPMKSENMMQQLRRWALLNSSRILITRQHS